MILMEPFLLMTLHFSHIGFTEDLTFILNLLSERMRLLRTKVRILVYYYADTEKVFASQAPVIFLSKKFNRNCCSCGLYYSTGIGQSIPKMQKAAENLFKTCTFPVRNVSAFPPHRAGCESLFSLHGSGPPVVYLMFMNTKRLPNVVRQPHLHMCRIIVTLFLRYKQEQNLRLLCASFL